jgi:hypothetical protein
MARTFAQAVQTTREILQDRYAPFRYSNGDLMLSINEGISEARRLRPDLFIDSLTTEIPFYTVTSFSENIPLPDEYFSAFVSYVAGRTNLRDDEFSADGRAAVLITTFAESLTGGRRK